MPRLGQDGRDRERVGDVRVAGLAELAAVVLLGDVVRPLQDLQVGLRVAARWVAISGSSTAWIRTGAGRRRRAGGPAGPGPGAGRSSGPPRRGSTRVPASAPSGRRPAAAGGRAAAASGTGRRRAGRSAAGPPCRPGPVGRDRPVHRPVRRPVRRAAGRAAAARRRQPGRPPRRWQAPLPVVPSPCRPGAGRPGAGRHARGRRAGAGRSGAGHAVAGRRGGGRGAVGGGRSAPLASGRAAAPAAPAAGSAGSSRRADGATSGLREIPFPRIGLAQCTGAACQACCTDRVSPEWSSDCRPKVPPRDRRTATVSASGRARGPASAARIDSERRRAPRLSGASTHSREVGRMTQSDEVAALVARTVRSVRTAHGMSPESLAARAGMPPEALLALEEGRELPALQTLIQVSDALLIPLARLVEGEPQPVIRLVPPERQPVLWHGPHGGTGRLVVGSDPKPALELWKLAAGAGRDPARHPAPARRPRDHPRRRGRADADPGRPPLHPRPGRRGDLRRGPAAQLRQRDRPATALHRDAGRPLTEPRLLDVRAELAAAAHVQGGAVEGPGEGVAALERARHRLEAPVRERVPAAAPAGARPPPGARPASARSC